jgi:hypothetical protein
MKKFFSSLILIGVFIACNSDKKTEAATEAAPVTPGIDNVNGNIPDTSESIRLNQPLPKDSASAADSSRR